ncbi:MAG TPA: YCF48-related protein [Candidatus Kapabacteria bacterium]|nr:YCF48-related protein [Candidatus Kapabacteria bacterium]
MTQPVISIPATCMLLSSPTTHNLNNVFFIDEHTGFVVGDSGTVLKTSNAGDSWSQVTVPTKQKLYDLYFFNSDTGFVCGDQVFFQTTNSGVTWAEIDSGLLFANIHFFDGVKAVLSGGKSSSGHQMPFLLVSSDGGASWDYRSPNFPANSSAPIYAGESFYDFYDGFLFIHDPLQGYASVYRTNDNGRTWNSVYYADHGISAAYCANSSTVYMCSDSGLVIKSTDFGLSWVGRTSGTTHDLSSLYFISADAGYAAGASGTIISTSDGGANWNSLSSGTSSALRAIYFPTASVGFVVGANGTIIKIL